MKLKIFAIILFISASLFAQDNDITKQIEGKISDAKIRVDKEINDPAINNKAETWYLYAYVYKEIAKSEVFAYLDATPEEKSINAIKKCQRIDLQSGKKFYSEIISLMLELGPIIYNKAINNYNSAVNNNNDINKFKISTYYFDLFYQVFDILGNDDKKFIEQFIEYNGINPDKTYIYSGFACDQVGEFAQAHKYYNNVIDITASDENQKTNSFPLVYYYEAELLIREGNTDKAKLVLDKGISVWPKDKDLVILAINFYKKQGDSDNLAEVMETAINNNPDNITLLYTSARNYNNISKEYKKNGYVSTSEKYREEAIKTYKKAIEIGTNNKTMEYGLNFNLGIIYYNKAAQMYNSQTGGIEEYQNTLKSAMPYIEKARQLDKSNPNCKKILINIYQTLEMNDKLNAIQNE